METSWVDRDDLSNVGMKVGGDQPRQTNGAQKEMDEAVAVIPTTHSDQLDIVFRSSGTNFTQHVSIKTSYIPSNRGNLLTRRRAPSESTNKVREGDVMPDWTTSLGRPQRRLAGIFRMISSP